MPPSRRGRATRLIDHRGWGCIDLVASSCRLSALFALDAFGGGFILQSIVAYWFYLRFHLDPAALGSIFFFANLLAAASALGAAALAKRFGLINTMVFTHLPSNVLLILVPLMPNLTLAVAVLLVRFSISQMDVPTRQSYTMAVVRPDERSAASGITTVARSIGAAISPSPRRLLPGKSASDQRAVLHRRGREDRVRSLPLSGIRVTRAWRQRLGPESDI